MGEKNGEHFPIRSRRNGQWRILEQDDGTRYWDLFQRFLRKDVETRTLRNAAKARDVYLLEDNGRKYILKWDHTGWGFGGEGRLERFFWKFVRGPFYSRLMKRVHKARKKGCDRCQAMYLVAERRTGHYCHEAVALYEYLEGETLEKLPDATPVLHDIEACLVSLHERNLALCDTNPRNFVLTPDGVKAIDLVCRGNARIDRVKDMVRAEKVFGIVMPAHGIDRALKTILHTYQKLRTRWVNYKSSKRTLRRNKLFRSSRHD